MNKKLMVPLGKSIMGDIGVCEINKMPHLLIAGTTGSGKSVCVNGIICSILMRAKPDEVKLMMVDPKVVELSVYNGVPHLLRPVVTDPKQASIALSKMVDEMERRYQEKNYKKIPCVRDKITLRVISLLRMEFFYCILFERAIKRFYMLCFCDISLEEAV